MDLVTQVLMEWLQQHLWPLTRVSSMIMSMALFSGTLVNARIKVLLSIAIVFAISPALPAVNAGVEMFSVGGMVVTAQQIVVGVALGLLSLLFLQTFVLGGQIIAMQIGLGFASMVDPTNGQQVPVIAQFFLMLASLIFLALDGHLLMIQMVVASFDSVPVAMTGLDADAFRMIADWGSSMFSAALTAMLSAIVALLLINLSFGIMTRAAPQLNIFAIGFPITMVSGLIVLWLTIGGFIFHFENQWQEAIGVMCTVIGSQC
ncbi:flagellar biosynthetic protein FliR [Idiomarina fontislapidosi]|uniref:Flagellar biosynthetic protein FliR n=1 Tax=Idiomarina fontislapidosi TaxID=263723 RepID=A0A432XRD1_9GAMM|nr:flagellar biosynthetic protein FliR [Idiomarina fontislapidosi]PYE31027.1 flagellar biosynthetic protein FliR [Idiomarina fontislapidosi]RUO51276.1 flagellar biosynthetic protein FliR [Idiomarina fontislapidosi]|tara:strand:- start:2625 stop:3407 length:783 start_codon:yes stop_codon:yes gene_type:complete